MSLMLNPRCYNLSTTQTVESCIGVWDRTDCVWRAVPRTNCFHETQRYDVNILALIMYKPTDPALTYSTQPSKLHVFYSTTQPTVIIAVILDNKIVSNLEPVKCYYGLSSTNISLGTVVLYVQQFQSQTFTSSVAFIH